MSHDESCPLYLFSLYSILLVNKPIGKEIEKWGNRKEDVFFFSNLLVSKLFLVKIPRNS